MHSGAIRANGAGPEPSRSPMTRSPAYAHGLLFALGSATLYGLNIVYARIAAFAGASGSSIVVYRVLLMLVLVAVVAAVTRRSLRMAPEERGTLVLLSVSTALASPVPSTRRPSSARV